MTLRIFYSWQLTTDSQYNKNFIANAIDKAVKKVKKNPDFKGIDFEVLEGVRGLPGSPPVADTIVRERIPKCDIFIADLSVVNQVSKFVKWTMKTFSNQKFKPFQNNNVILEYGVARNALGVERIIGVLNKAYGSANDNPDNIPFDIQHLRFPIPYEYSAKTSQAQRDKTLKDLTDGIATAIRDTADYALQNRKNRYYPFNTWNSWAQLTTQNELYVQNTKTSEVAKLALETCKLGGSSLRILGLSGLGKTRILLETFRPTLADPSSLLLSNRILYVNANDSPSFDEILSKIASENEDHIIIVDNCKSDRHRNLLKYFSKESRLSLITISSDPEEIDRDKITGVNYIQIKKDDFIDVVEEILNKELASLPKESIERIKEFSQGIPMMATLLGDSVKNGETFIGRLDDKYLLGKLLGAKGEDERNRKILKSCSLFNFIGYYDTYFSQTEFIAKNKNITSLDGDDIVLVNEFREVCEHYLKREIFEKRGRFISMRPFPLAISLAQEWLDPITSTRLVEVIKDIANLQEPDRNSLSEALAEQMKFLGYDNKAKEIILMITGPSSPFDDAEVLNTELGSRLFRSFVEVNPVAITNNLTRLFSTKSTAELLTIDQGRRNLVWVLEKACFDRKTFEPATKIMFQFAVAENESWANNATGQFLRLFKVLLPGTEASLLERWKIIEWGLAHKDEEFKLLALRAMKVGLHYGHFSRDGGAERQGTRTLTDYAPTWGEIAEYWKLILQRSIELITSKSKYAQQAEDTITSNIRSTVRAGEIQTIMPFIEDLAKVKKYDWDEGLDALKSSKKYDKLSMSPEHMQQVDELILALTKTDFITRYTKLSKSYHLETDESYSSEKVIEAMLKLADEFIETKISWEEALPVFYGSQQVFSHHFGKRLYQLLKTDDDQVANFITKSLEVILTIPKEARDVSVLGGFITESEPTTKREFYISLSKSEELFYLLFYFISIDKEGKNYIDLLFELVGSNKSALGNFRILRYSNSIQYMDDKEVAKFCDRLYAYDKEGYEVAFDLVFGIWFNNAERKPALYPILKTCIYKIGVNRTQIAFMDQYHLFHVIADILNDPAEKDFAKFINSAVVNSIDWKNSYHLDHDMQKVYRELMEHHFDVIWGDLSNGLLASGDNYITFYGLKHILGSHIGGVGPTVGILFDGDIDAIFKWARENSPLAPERLALLVPIFNESVADEWHPIARRLIDEFGEIQDVIRHLSANMGTFSWSGSIVPLLESKKKLFQSLVDHPKEQIRNWATSALGSVDKSIEQERNRDEESSFI